MLPLPSRITLFGLAKNPWNLIFGESVVVVTRAVIVVTRVPILRDVSGTIGGRSGDLTNVGRVTRVWVETKWGLVLRCARVIKTVSAYLC